MQTILQHIHNIMDQLEDPIISKQSRRHLESELISLKKYQSRHSEESHIPSSLELFCEENPHKPECKIFE
jgi:hypothetical protein